MKPKPKLLASSPKNDFDGIKRMISKFWYCKPDDISFETIKICMFKTPTAQVIKSGASMPGFIIRHKAGRIRFEYLGGES